MMTLAVSPYLVGLAVVGFVALSVLMVLMVLIQRPQGGGLSGAFGASSGSGQTAFGAKTGDALTIATIIVFVTWLLAAIGLVFLARPAEDAGPVVPSLVEPGEDPVDLGGQVDPEPAAERTIITPDAAEDAVDGAVDGAVSEAPEPIDAPPAEGEGSPSEPQRD